MDRKLEVRKKCTLLRSAVSLARAVYSRASTLLLDDVISAVDAHTSQHIINYCFKSPLLSGRTIIVASHAVESLAPLAAYALFLEESRISWRGTGPALLESKHMSHLKTGAPSQTGDCIPTEDSLETSRSRQIGADDFVYRADVPKTPRQLILDEAREKGNVKTEHWKTLLHFNGGTAFWAGYIMSMVAVCLSPVAERRVLE